jgi:hypothetical protein
MMSAVPASRENRAKALMTSTRRVEAFFYSGGPLDAAAAVSERIYDT